MNNKRKNDINMEEITIGKIGQHGLAEFRALRLESLKTVPEAYGSSYEDEYAFPEETWKSRIPNMLFAHYRESLIGMIGFLVRSRPKTSHVVDVFSFYVSKKYQGNGVGKKLIEEVINTISRNSNVRKISLSVSSEMEAAIHLYSKFGFQVSGKLVNELNINGIFYDEFIMEKLLW